jgi:hypothetical protein
MTLQRMEHVGIVVDDLAAATELFAELGLELLGEGSVEGRSVDRIVGLDGDKRHARANTPGIRDIASRSRTSTPSSPACEPAALNSSASWSATRTATGSATSAARRESSSSERSRSATGLSRSARTSSSRSPAMSRSATKAEINEYLAVEWDLDVDAVSDDRPFELHWVGETPQSHYPVYSFADGDEPFFAFSGPTIGCLPAAGMTFAQLRLQLLGAGWIAEQDPVDLNTSRIGDPEIPAAVDRRARIAAMIEDAGLDPATSRVLEGLFLTSSRRFLALVQANTGDVHVLLDGVRLSHPSDAPLASAWRRLSVAVGHAVENAPELLGPGHS